MTIIPEFILLTTIKKALDLIEVDHKLCETENRIEESYLYRVFGDNQIERYQYYEQAKAILFKKKDDPRKLTIDLMYNMKMDKVPTIYITLPGEQHGQNAMTVEQEDEPYWNDNGSFTDKFTRRKSATYAIYITSDNSNEVSLLYHLLDSILISATAGLALSGLYNLTQGGQDIQLENDKTPKHFFIKALSIGLQYGRTVPGFAGNPIFNELLFVGRPTGLKSEENDTPNNFDDL